MRLIHTRWLVLSLLTLGVAACDSPISFSEPVGINLKVKSSDTVNNAVSQSKGITTETGNPYGAFVNDARAKLGGRDPSRIDITTATLTLGGTSTGVSALEQIFTGDVNFSFVMNDTNNTYFVGKVTNPTGVGPVALQISFDPSLLSAVDYTKLLNGSFKVALLGTAATNFSTKGADASLQVTITFEAHE